MNPKLLLAMSDGTVLEHPALLALARSGEDIVEPVERPIPMPRGGRLVHLPGRRPVGRDPATGRAEVLDRLRIGARSVVPNAVGALLPPGYTRTLLPADLRVGGPVLSQWAYAAAGWGSHGPVVWALRTDRRTHWDPARFSTSGLAGLVEARLARSPRNRVLRQLETCALEYRCFTSQNIFYERDEGALPASVACNARCVGCISEEKPGGPPASHARIREAPPGEELAEVATHHLLAAAGRSMVSFGQGCEGEPLTRVLAIEDAIRRTRRKTARGSINVNTNGSRPQAMARLLDAGLDACRVSLNSAHAELYAAYYNPVGYSFDDVEATLSLARRRGAYVALNLLVFPGVTDRLGEVLRLVDLVVRHRVDQVQARSLCIDADQYMEVARGRGALGEPIGVRQLLSALKAEAPWVEIGNFARARFERRPTRAGAGRRKRS